MKMETLKRFPFLEGNKRECGEVQVARYSDDSTETITVALHTRHGRVRLPRNRLGEVIAALTEANAFAQDKYLELLKETNNGTYK